MELLTRDKFREGTFARDNHKCVWCGAPAQDAHHILERRLFTDGGYYLNNGASLCGPCHLEAEKTNISVEDLRHKIGITKPALPEHFYSDVVYDKWGNVCQANGTRLKGELFFDESVQKIIREHLPFFVDYVKYPRTYHLPWSESLTDDDRYHPDADFFAGKEVVITEKLDGENTSLYTDYYHARSTESKSHPSQDWCKNFHSQIKHEIPQGWRICGENMYSKHSIAYDELESFFYGFSIWNERNCCLSWDETLEWFALLGIKPVPVLYRGVFDISRAVEIFGDLDTDVCEGYVIRVAEGFDYANFKYSIAKCVRKNHVQTVQHWKYGQPIVPNKLKD